MGRYTSGGIGRDVLAGAAAGLAAIWVADKLDKAIYRAGSRDSIRRTEAARPGGMDPAHALAKRAADKVGVDVGDPKDNVAGHTVHYGIAAGLGALYGLLRGIAPGVSAGRGAVFGIAAFVLQDRLGNTMLGTAGDPLKYPVRDYARGAAAHTLFGIVTDLGVRLLSPWRNTVVIEHGPPLAERLDRGRAYLTQGREDLVRQGRQRLVEGRAYLDQGLDTAGEVAGQARARLPAMATVTRAGRRLAAELIDEARGYVPKKQASGFSRTLDRLLG